MGDKVPIGTMHSVNPPYSWKLRPLHKGRELNLSKIDGNGGKV